MSPRRDVGRGVGIASCVVCLFGLIAAAAVPPFTDITKAAGITFVHNNGAAGKRYYPETMGSGAIFFDLDGGHQGFSHRLDRHELHDVEQLDLGAESGREHLRAPPHRCAVLEQIDDEQNATISRHGYAPDVR
jgi:hypothetical protein